MTERRSRHPGRRPPPTHICFRNVRGIALRGLRIGEAKNPGPDTPPRHRLRHKTPPRLAGPSSDGTSSLPASQSLQSKADVAASPSTAASTMADSPPKAPQRRSRGQIRDDSLTINVELLDEGEKQLTCARIAQGKSWRWQITTRGTRRARQHRDSPAAALEEWRKAFSHLLAPASAIDLEAQITQLRAMTDPQPSQDNSLLGTVTPGVVMCISDTATVYHGGCIPDTATCERILEASLHQFLAWNIHTQVELPRSCLSLVSSSLTWLLRIADDVTVLASQRNVAKLFLLLAPKLLALAY